jgi:hypothetical protein
VTESAGPSTGASSTADSAAVSEQSSLAAPRGLSYAVDIVFCIYVTGSMTPIIDQVKANALRFYDDVQSNLTETRKTPTANHPAGSSVPLRTERHDWRSSRTRSRVHCLSR